ncbi:MAG: Lpp/OprI family alanine-zipper lipoprotein, partial [Thiohalobacterales bacterium]
MKGPILYRSRIIAMAAAVGMVAGLGGCATTNQLNELQADVDAAKADASAAKAEAAAASRTANEAKAMASDAVNTANAAKATSEETETKIDRMFKKAMY